MKTNFTFYSTKGIQNVYFPYLPNINLSEYAKANQFCITWSSFLTVLFTLLKHTVKMTLYECHAQSFSGIFWQAFSISVAFCFSFCFVPPLTTSIMPPFMIYAHRGSTQKFANWQIFISCGHPNLTVCCWGSWPSICQIMYGYNIHPSKLLHFALHEVLCWQVYLHY
jgi:hypothetical protein